MKEIRFERNKFYDVTRFAMHPDLSEELIASYLSPASRMLEACGGAFLASFAVSRVSLGQSPAQRINIIEWPSLDAYREFFREENFNSFKDLRQRIFSYTSFGNLHTIVEDSVSVSFRDELEYAFTNVWPHPEKLALLQEYQKRVAPILAPRGIRQAISLRRHDIATGDIDAPIMNIGVWPSLQVFDQLMADDEFRQARLLRDQALTNILTIHTRLVS